ncbi:MAG: outer membrane protein [Bacteroidia bacterium]|jgi:outer membrane protein
MKKISSLIAVVLMMAIAAPTFAQQKFGHIDSAALLDLMPEKAKAEKDLEAFAIPFNDELKKMAAELESKMVAFESTQEGMTKLVRQTKVTEIQDMQTRIQQFQENAQGEISTKEQEVLGPIVEKARKAIDEVANDKGYTYVFDASLGVLLYMKDSNDIMAEVKVKLGI